jgi:hypothetical protein
MAIRLVGYLECRGEMGQKLGVLVGKTKGNRPPERNA